MLGKRLKKLIVKILILVIISVGSIMGWNYHQTNKIEGRMNRIILKQMQTENENGRLKTENTQYKKALEDFQKLDENYKLLELEISKCFDLRLVKGTAKFTGLLEKSKSVFGIKHIARQRVVDMTYMVNVMLEGLDEIQIQKDYSNNCLIITIPDDYIIEIGKVADNSYDAKQSAIANPYSASYINGMEDSIYESVLNKMTKALKNNGLTKSDKLTTNVNDLKDSNLDLIMPKNYDIEKGLLANTKDSFREGMESLVKSLGIDNIVFK